MLSIATVIAVTIAGQVTNESSGRQDAANLAAAAAERAAAAAEIAANAAAKVAGVPLTTAPAGKAAPAAPSAATWSGTAGLGLISVTGNAKALTFSANATVERKSQEWIFTAKANGAYR